MENEGRLLHVMRHSPDGFEWGYGGSGPSDLARSILVEHFAGVWKNEPMARREQARKAEQQAESLYHKFKFEFVAMAPSEGFVVTEREIEEWLERQ